MKQTLFAAFLILFSIAELNANPPFTLARGQTVWGYWHSPVYQEAFPGEEGYKRFRSEFEKIQSNHDTLTKIMEAHKFTTIEEAYTKIPEGTKFVFPAIPDPAHDALLKEVQGPEGLRAKAANYDTINPEYKQLLEDQKVAAANASWWRTFAIVATILVVILLIAVIANIRKARKSVDAHKITQNTLGKLQGDYEVLKAKTDMVPRREHEKVVAEVKRLKEEQEKNHRKLEDATSEADELRRIVDSDYVRVTLPSDFETFSGSRVMYFRRAEPINNTEAIHVEGFQRPFIVGKLRENLLKADEETLKDLKIRKIVTAKQNHAPVTK